MTNWPTFKKEDFKRISWGEYGDLVETIVTKVKNCLEENNLKIDLVVPILRGGGILGIALAYRLEVLKVIPVQYKYYFKGKDAYDKRILFPEKELKAFKESVILVVENNHCFGGTAKTAIKDLKELLPDAKIIYASATMDYSNQQMEGVLTTFYGKLTNEARGLNEEEAKEKGLSQDLSLFPWENLEEEWSSVNLKGFKYQDQSTQE
jgi:hypoxanthine phosphoribosyltransferase